jgi:hypothetical protein
MKIQTPTQSSNVKKQKKHLTEFTLHSEETILCFHCGAQLQRDFHVYTLYERYVSPVRS